MAWGARHSIPHRSQGAQDSKHRFQQAQRSATGTQQPQGIASGWLHQFNVLLQRAWLYKIRDEMVVITQVRSRRLALLRVALTPSTRLGSIREGAGWSFFRF